VTDVPEWLWPLVGAAGSLRVEQLTHLAVPQQGGRKAAVLVLFGESADGPDLLLIERSADLRSHAGQPAFPGGAIEPTDGGPVGAALREAGEETGLDPAGVEVLATLPELWVPPSGFVVVPVLGWWREPSAVRPVDPAEVAAVVRVPLAQLAEPTNRVRVRHPSGYTGPAFEVAGLLVWGFTAGLIDRLLALGGWERPWRPGQVRRLPAELRRPVGRTPAPGRTS